MDGPARDSICVYPTRPPSPPADFIRVDLRLSLSSASRYPLLSSPPFFLSLRSRTYDEKLDDERRHLNWFRSTVRWSLVLLDVSRKKKREIQNFFLPSGSFRPPDLWIVKEFSGRPSFSMELVQSVERDFL